MINKKYISKDLSGKMMRNMVINPTKGYPKNIVGQATYTEKKSNYEMDRLKYEYRRK